MPGTPEDPLRIAVVGSGPAGFYTVQHLFQARQRTVQIDMFDRLPMPFGLVRHGVAPDHPKIKSVVKVYDKLAHQPGFRFFGNVDFGDDLDLATLQAHYHQIVFATGAQTDRRLGIPGEDLLGSHPATEFVAWYNGHPDFSNFEFDLSCERAVVIGVGNVAIDVARILCRSHEELRKTDIADYALEALRHSRIREVLLVGRRGPAQAAFTNPEIQELGELSIADARTLADEVELDPLSRRSLDQHPDRSTERKVEILQAYSGPSVEKKSKTLVIRFLLSPTEILAGAEGQVAGIRFVRNELFEDESEKMRSRSTERFEEIETGLVFRSVGYRGVPLQGLPFHDAWGVIPNDKGRIQAGGSELPLTGLYVSGWIKRGPSGVIGTNKPDAGETVAAMLEDLDAGRSLRPDRGAPDAIVEYLRRRGSRFVSYEDWKKIDAEELSRGESQGRPRLKITENEEFLKLLTH